MTIRNSHTQTYLSVVISIFFVKSNVRIIECSLKFVKGVTKMKVESNDFLFIYMKSSTKILSMKPHWVVTLCLYMDVYVITLPAIILCSANGKLRINSKM